MTQLIPGTQQHAVEGAEIAHERISVVTADDAPRLQVIDALALATVDLLAVAREIEGLIAATVGTEAVIGPETIEVGQSDDEAYAVAGTELEGGVVLLVGGDDIVLTGCLAVVAGHVDMTEG